MKRRTSSQLWEMTTSSSEEVTREASQGLVKLGIGISASCAAMSAAAAVAKTMHSSSELLASRLAPCSPVKAHSPIA
jgi:hypothetical protein